MSERTEESLDPVRFRVGKCPACRGYVWADVWITVHVGEPTLDQDGSGNVHACAKPTAASVAHKCNGRDEE